MDDQRLLREFTEHGSQAAFSELTRRHLRLVYSVCHRELGDAETARDATQVVFLLLARKARSLRGHAHLPGWLFHTSRLAAKNVRKQERRRILREQTMIEQTMADGGRAPSEWEALEPSLNDALASLKSSDRDAVLLRFFEGRTLAEVGAHLGASEDAARKRVDRALDRMRDYLARHGVAVPAGAALALLLSAHAAKAVPAGCAAAVRALGASVVAGSAVSVCVSAKVAQMTQGVINAMTMTTLKTAALVLVIAGVGAGGIHQIAAGAKAASGGPVIAAPGPAPKIVRQAVRAAYAGDFSAIASALNPEMQSVLTGAAVASMRDQLAVFGAAKETALVSRQAVDGGVDYRFTVHAEHGIVNGRLGLDAGGKIDLFALTPGAIAPSVSPQSLLEQAVKSVIAGDAAALRSKSNPAMAAVLTADAVTSMQSQFGALGAVSKIAIDDKKNADGFIVSSFHIDFAGGGATGTLTEDAQSRIAGLEFHPAP